MKHFSIHKRALIQRCIRGEFGLAVMTYVGSVLMRGEGSHYYGDAQCREYWALVAAWQRILEIRSTGEIVQ